MNPARRHIPVLGREAVDMLAPGNGGVFVDATFGAGGYSRAILETPQARVIAYDVTSDGKVSNQRDFATWPPDIRGAMDGLKVDMQGNVWATGPGGVNIITPQGKNLGHIQVSGRTASNVAFGGPTLGDLYVTGSPGAKSGPGALFRLHLGIRGRSSSATPAP